MKSFPRRNSAIDSIDSCVMNSINNNHLEKKKLTNPWQFFLNQATHTTPKTHKMMQGMPNNFHVCFQLGMALFTSEQKASTVADFFQSHSTTFLHMQMEGVKMPWTKTGFGLHLKNNLMVLTSQVHQFLFFDVKALFLFTHAQNH